MGFGMYRKLCKGSVSLDCSISLNTTLIPIKLEHSVKHIKTECSHFGCMVLLENNSFPLFFQNSRRTPLWDIFDERESTDSLDNEDEEMVTFELSEMLLMLLAAGTDDEVTDSEDEWDLFHDELDDFYEIYL